MSGQDEVYDQCLIEVGEDFSNQDLIKCISGRWASYEKEDPLEFSRSVLLVYSASLIFFMQAGFAMLCAGSVRSKNVRNTMLKNLLDACGASAAFFTVGYAFAYGGDNENLDSKTFIGSTNFLLMDVDDYAFWFFQYAFSAASATIVAGTLAERCQMGAYFGYSLFLGGFVYPVIVHSVWSRHGFLSPDASDPLWGTGMIDFAGGGVVHTTGGVTALIATIILGPRKGRFHDEEGRQLAKPKEFYGHSIALQMLGTLILWFGWYGFNAGSALTILTEHKGKVAALAAVNTTLSGGTAGIVGLFTNFIIEERRTGEPCFDLKYAMNGALSGLVAITAACGVIEPWAAMSIGFCAGILYIVASRALIKFRLDDAVDAIPVHLANGVWGVLSVGLFASPARLEDSYGVSKHVGWFYSWGRGSADAHLLAAQLAGVVFIISWVTVIMLPFFVWLSWKGWFRSDELEELVGLDRSYHGEGLAMHSEEVNPEYVNAFNKQRELRRAKQTARSANRSGEESGESVANLPRDSLVSEGDRFSDNTSTA
mmetsp:Transcript_937/g.1484  ORF Transcript_937/g.1484 Transcript_937/m.1484 type:complete len:540 (+) Transcript_937:302-1921(+)|eukprot:CAMPEP_0195295438 /NCGR_PEP_ID=MMETSP0707-20130614/17394_1 /TAXON_ID=33640 /ORGANISM="Asterionellopsis glacialis, Strain CCMP134" /LENGTH=539 /DNA_ID=CAMNT_0040356671 /DNA_START=251 /DNA_END=1870 /DNA_ORIENTATION=-